jgi:hypothetical protein
MKLKMWFRLMNDADASGGGGSAQSTTPSLIGGAPTPAPGQSASAADTSANAPVVKADEQQQSLAAQAAEVKADATEAPPEKVVPEKYEFKEPEGVTLDKEVLGEFEGLAKELKLSQEEAQKVSDIGAKLAQKWEAKQADVIQQASAEWAASASADKEFGGDKLTESLTTAKKALDAFGTPELRTLLNESHLGNHPEVIRFMVRAGKAISEDSKVVTGGRQTVVESTAKRMYPNMNP